MTIDQVIQSSFWIVPALLLAAASWQRFNTPPTNRSGTTFALFYFGLICYYFLIIALWALIIVVLSQTGVKLLAHVDPETKAEFAQYNPSPLIAALIIVVASQFRKVLAIDTEARSFCIKLAGIPLEADRLAVELANSADFEPQNEQLLRRVSEIIARNIGPRALGFGGESIEARFTRAVALYWLFIGPRNNVRKDLLPFPTNRYSRSAYVRIMELDETTTVARTESRYEEMINSGLAYFTTPNPAKHLSDVLSKNITEVANLVCSLIARFVLYCDRTRSARRQRLLDMGFTGNHPLARIGLDQWATTIVVVMALSFGLMFFGPGIRRPTDATVLTIPIIFAFSIGFAVSGAVLVAQRFIERFEGEKLPYPPMVELLVAGLAVAGLSVALRIAIPLVHALFENGSLQEVVQQFVKRSPGIIVPFFCTISLGLLCAYADSLNRSWFVVAAVGALGNALAFVAAGAFVGLLLEPDVLDQFYVHPEQARTLIVINNGIIGAVIGAIVLGAFRRSERVRKDVNAQVAGENIGVPEKHAPTGPEIAPLDFGRYARSNVQEMEGCYICFRPGFTSPGLITAYLIILRWDEAESCLVFEEHGRADAAHTQKGRVYIPNEVAQVNFVTLEKGSIRVIMVSRPEKQGSSRGLILSLSNPTGTVYTPASAPVVLRRVKQGEIPQLGFIRPGMPGYDAYSNELETVIPAFGLFAPPLGTGAKRKVTTSRRRTGRKADQIRKNGPRPLAP
jgi:hypothetical protein